MSRTGQMLRATVLLAAGVLLTLADGVAHGLLTFRWEGTPAARREAASRLPQVPLAVGDWEVVESEPLSAYVLNILRSDAYLNRVYVHRPTGQRVKVTVLLGPFGQTSTHIPDMCYATQDYRIVSERNRVRLSAGGGETAELWVLPVQAGNLDAAVQRVYYGWSDGRRWEAPQEPRLHYGGRPYLYKVQASAIIDATSETEVPDACRDFLQEFLPSLQPFLLAPDS